MIKSRYIFALSLFFCLSCHAMDDYDSDSTSSDSSETGDAMSTDYQYCPARTSFSDDFITEETLDDIKREGVESALMLLTEKHREQNAMPWWTYKYFRWLFNNDIKQYPIVCDTLTKFNANTEFFTKAKQAHDDVNKKRKSIESGTVIKRSRT